MRSLLQWNGVVTVRWELSTLGYVIATVLCLWSFSRWEVPARWKRIWRWAATALIAIALLSAGSLGVITEYRREHPHLQVEAELPFVDPPLIASDAEKLPHVDRTKRPLIEAHAGDSFFCKRRIGGFVVVHMMIGVADLGIPTALGGWRLHYQSDRLDQWFRYTEIPDNDTCDDGKGKTFSFHKKDSIYEETDRRVEPGTKYRGWARFEIPAVLYDEAGTKYSRMTIEFQDHQLHKYTVTFVGTGDFSGQPFYYPGVDPTVKTRKGH
jgi:hypothetical protein